MTSPHAVLIVDADPKGLESLVYGFQGADWRLTACPAPETASLLVKASAAKLVVIASRGEHEKMHSLVRQLRTKEATRSLPILVLGPEDLRPTLAQFADVDLLPLPTFVRDVLVACELLVAAGAAQKPGEEPLWEAPITGALILSIVRSMSGLSRSGQLRLERNGRVGEILFHQGELTAASIGPLQAMAAVQHLMIWNDGKLELHLRQVPRRGQLRLSADELLQELDRFQRDYAHAMKEIGPATTTYAASQERLRQAGGAVPAEVTPVVRLCDGNRPLADVIDESPFRVLDTVRILGRLAALGILTRADGKPVLGTGAARTGNDEFLDTARIEEADRAWPMPAPIGAIPTPTPFAISPTAPVQVGERTAAALPEPTPAPPKESGRPRRQTREICTPSSSSANLPRQTPRPVEVPPGAAASGAMPAAPRMPASDAQVTPIPVVHVTPAPVRPRADAQVTPPPVTPRPDVQVTPPPVAPRPLAHVTPKPVAHTTPAPVTPIPIVHVATTPVSPRPFAHVTPAAVVTLATPAVQANLVAHAPAAAARPAGTPSAPFPPAASEPTTAPPAAQTGSTITAATSATATARFGAPAAPVAASGAVGHPLATPPSGPNAIGPVTSMAGVIESRKAERRSQHNLRAVSEQPSVVIAGIPIEDVKLPQASTSSPAPEATPPAKNPARITGTLQTTPARRGPGQSTPTPPVSIQVDSSLSDPFRSNQPTPLLTSGQIDPARSAPAFRSSSPTPPIAGTPASARVTGELRTVSSGRAPRSPAKAPAASSFHIDPSLSAEAAVQSAAPPAAPATPAKRSDSQPTPGFKRRASGSFSALESDFFAREADLYKEEKPESFADLDTGKPKPNGKAGGRPRK